jgi:hypothetical protein
MLSLLGPGAKPFDSTAVERAFLEKRPEWYVVPIRPNFVVITTRTNIREDKKVRAFMFNSHKIADHRGKPASFLIDKSIVDESPTPAVWDEIRADLAKVRPYHLREFARDFPKFRTEIEELYMMTTVGRPHYGVIDRVTTGRRRDKPNLCYIGYLVKT